MAPWLKNRFEIIKLTLRYPKLLMFLWLLQVIDFALLIRPELTTKAPVLHGFLAMPWYAWVIGWLAFLWISAIDYSVERRNRFDFTSRNFFKSYLDFIINEGGRLLALSEDKNFYSKVSEWQRQVVEGIAIGLGPQESEKHFQKVDGQNPLTEAYRKSLDTKTNDPLCRALLDNIDELKVIRASLVQPEDEEVKQIAAPETESMDKPVLERKMKQIGGSTAGLKRKTKA